MTEKKRAKLANQDGISLVLSVIIVTALVGVVIVAANINRRVTRDSALIRASEAAFLAAESAAELTLYDVVKNKLGLDNLPDRNGQVPLGAFEQAGWTRQVTAALSLPSRCDVSQPRSVCAATAGAINESNALQVTLQSGESFQLDLNLVDATYPDSIDISGVALSQSEIIIVSNGLQQRFTNPVGDVNISDLGAVSGTRLRLINNTTDPATYTFTPQGVGDLPLGLNISTTGAYQDVERRIEVTKPAWLIYQ